MAETLVATLAATLSETMVETIGETQCDVETSILVKRLAFKLELASEALHTSRCLTRYQMLTPRNTGCHTSREGSRDNCQKKLLHCKKCRVLQSLHYKGNVDAERLINTLADCLSETNVDTIDDTLGNVRSEQLTHTLTNTQENAKTGRLNDKLA